MMKNIKSFIFEKLKIGADTNIIEYTPTTHQELKETIKEILKTKGMSTDLSNIDTSKITDMHDLFSAYPDFNGNVSSWDTHNVTNMSAMFAGCELFNCDISGWDVSSVTNMTQMFLMCRSFNQNLTGWDTSSLKRCTDMFVYCKAKKPNWYTNR